MGFFGIRAFFHSLGLWTEKHGREKTTWCVSSWSLVSTSKCYFAFGPFCPVKRLRVLSTGFYRIVRKTWIGHWKTRLVHCMCVSQRSWQFRLLTWVGQEKPSTLGPHVSSLGGRNAISQSAFWLSTTENWHFLYIWEQRRDNTLWIDARWGGIDKTCTPVNRGALVALTNDLLHLQMMVVRRWCFFWWCLQCTHCECKCPESRYTTLSGAVRKLTRVHGICALMFWSISKNRDTAELQRTVVLNKPFKTEMRKLWQNGWDLTKWRTLENLTNFLQPGLSVVVTWMKQAWDSLPNAMVARMGKNVQ